MSSKVHCQHCSTRKRGKDKTEHFHAMVSATLVAPDHNRVVPLEPEFIVPQDGHEKQDCESRAVRRWLERHGRHHARLKPIYLGDDLFSRQPICEAVRAVGGHFLFVCKPVVPPDDRGIPHRHRSADADPHGQARAAAVRLPLPLAERRPAARRCRRPDRQLADDRDRQRRR